MSVVEIENANCDIRKQGKENFILSVTPPQNPPDIQKIASFLIGFWPLPPCRATLVVRVALPLCYLRYNHTLARKVIAHLAHLLQNVCQCWKMHRESTARDDNILFYIRLK